MKHPWQIWILYGLFVTLIVTAMGWLTVQTLELNRKEVTTRRELENARRIAEQAHQQSDLARQEALFAQQQVYLEGQISSALWRIDTILTPLLAQEVAQPYYYFRPFYSVPSGGKGKSKSEEVHEVASPLLMQPSDQVLLHFLWIEQGELASPQCPSEDTIADAIERGIEATSIPRDNIALSRQRLQQLQQRVPFDQLLQRLPADLEPVPQVAQVPFNDANWLWNNSSNLFLPNADPPVVNLPEQALQQQTELSQTGQQRGQQAGQQVGQQLRQAQVGVGPTQQADSRQAGQQQLAQGPPIPTTPPPRANSQQRQQPVGPPVASPQAASLQPPQQQAAVPQSARGQVDGPPADLPQSGAYRQRSTTYAPPSAAQVDNRASSVYPQQESETSLMSRTRAAQYLAQNAVRQQRRVADIQDGPDQLPVKEGPSQPMWVGDQLILARRVVLGGQQAVIGSWLNWPILKQQLLSEIADLLPNVDLVPIPQGQEVAANRRLATLPIQLVVVEPVFETTPLTIQSPAALSANVLSSIEASLWIAWGCLLLTTVALGILLKGVMTLSERRASFVAAVTHELRTPLTTFRMYAEMLAEEMVPDRLRQKQYMRTLQVESDRLAHLVENVLQYARLERGRGGKRREVVSVGDMLGRLVSRLQERANQANMQLEVDMDPSVGKLRVTTDPSAVEQILFNLVDNACKYAATASDRRILLAVTASTRFLMLQLSDHGPGIPAEHAAGLFRPFSKSVDRAAATAPGVGLGLALCRRLARALGGRLILEPPRQEPGASFRLELPR